jgi:hypothetical protein
VALSTRCVLTVPEEVGLRHRSSAAVQIGRLAVARVMSSSFRECRVSKLTQLPHTTGAEHI